MCSEVKVFKMNSLLVFCSVLIVAFAQEPSLSCNYLVFDGLYTCYLTINNPNGFNNFTEIGGTNLEGFTGEDVGVVNGINGFSTNVPSIICDTFPNLHLLELGNIGLTEIDDDSVSGCTLLTQLFFYRNRINSISANAFVNNPNINYINLENNMLTTLPENVFASQRNMGRLDMNVNPFEDIPDGIFRSLTNLQVLHLSYANLTAIKNQWFETTVNINQLYLAGNRITLTPESLIGLERLFVLSLAFNEMNEVPQTFGQLTNLLHLDLYGNNFTELRADSFPGLGNLPSLDIGYNPIGVIHDGAFRGLVNMTALSLSDCGLRQLNSNSFDGLGRLGSLSLNFNEIEELPQGLFVPMPSLTYIGLWDNRLKTLRRNSFGMLSNLQTLDLDGNIVNALDRDIIDDAVSLNTFYFRGNLCADNWYLNFLISRAQYLPMLERCFDNMRYIVGNIYLLWNKIFFKT